MIPLTWELLKRVFTVETIMTPRKELLTWERGADASALISEAKRQRFDLIPVTENDRIIGVMLGRPDDRNCSRVSGWSPTIQGFLIL